MNSDELEELEKLQNEKIVTELKSWKSRFKVNDKGKPLSNSIFNVELILDNDLSLKDKLGFNEFTGDEQLKKSVGLDGLTIQSGLIEDNFTHALRSYIEQTYNFVPTSQNVESAVINVSRKNSYNPLKEYLQAAKEDWDGTPRIETLLSNYLGVEQSEYAYKGLLCLLIGSIQKVYAPKQKFDFVFDFVGDTGTGKTSLLQKVFLESKGYYTDSFSSFAKTDDFTIMQRAWCVNDDELVVSKKTGIEVLKKFASQKELEYRTPYARRTIRRPKGFVLVRTSNESGHLKDETGNRRFIPFKARTDHQKYHPLTMDENRLDDSVIKQLWGEAMREYDVLDRQKLYIEVEKLAHEYQEEFTNVDSIKEIVLSVLDVPVPSNFYEFNDYERASYIQGYLSNNNNRHTIGTTSINPDDLVTRDRVRIRDLSLEGFDESYGKNTNRDRRIRLIMDNNKAWEKSKKNGIRFGKQTNTGYMRK